MHIHGRLGNCRLRRVKAEKARYKIAAWRWKEKPARERIISAFAKTPPGDTLAGEWYVQLPRNPPLCLIASLNHQPITAIAVSYAL